MVRVFTLIMVFMALVFAPVFALEPNEALFDSVLEKRARSLSSDLRCPVCQNQSIDDSDAPLARDLRLLLRERLVAGDTDEEVLAYVSVRYGEFILLKPTRSPKNSFLWGAPIIFLLFGGVILWRRLQKGQNIKNN